MTPRQQRMTLIGLVLAGVAVAAVFALQAFQENLLYFYNPSQVVAGDSRAPRRCSASRCSAGSATSCGSSR